MNNTMIRGWSFTDGTLRNPLGDSLPRGWYCRVFTADHEDKEFTDWMRTHCPTADCTLRFNSGDPMYTIYISDDNEAQLFVLRWL